MSTPIKTTPLQMAVWLTIAWVIGMISGTLATRAYWEPRAKDARAEHAQASLMIVDLQLENQELRDQLALGMIEEAPTDVPLEFVDQECDVYAFDETAVVIQQTADFIELAYVEMDAVQHLLICAQMHPTYLLDIFNWSNDVMRLMEFALSDLNPDWKDDPLEWTDVPPGYPGIYEVPSS